MSAELREVFRAQGGVATSAQVHSVLTRRESQSQLATGQLFAVWQGIYSDRPPGLMTQLRGLDLRTGDHIAICLSTAARAYGFDTEDVAELHVLTTIDHRLRNTNGLVVHRRNGAPLSAVRGRRATAPAWTAVEVARTLPRPRALATLDAALRTRTCDREELVIAADQQRGRRGIAHARELIPLADGRSESPMESEARLVMHDGRLPAPLLQHRILDLDGRRWRVDFAWPDAMLVVEYDSVEFHSDTEDFRRDRQKWAALQEMNWTVIILLAADVRGTPEKTVRRIGACLS
ncbi:MAG: hypothetical protein ACSLE6_12775 [Mycobacterium sp.]